MPTARQRSSEKRHRGLADRLNKKKEKDASYNNVVTYTVSSAGDNTAHSSCMRALVFYIACMSVFLPVLKRPAVHNKRTEAQGGPQRGAADLQPCLNIAVLVRIRQGHWNSNKQAVQFVYTYKTNWHLKLIIRKGLCSLRKAIKREERNQKALDVEV